MFGSSYNIEVIEEMEKEKKNEWEGNGTENKGMVSVFSFQFV